MSAAGAVLLCRGGRREHVWQWSPFRGGDGPGDYAVQRCMLCGLVRRQPLASFSWRVISRAEMLVGLSTRDRRREERAEQRLASMGVAPAAPSARLDPAKGEGRASSVSGITPA